MDDAVANTRMFFYITITELVFVVIAAIAITIMVMSLAFSYVRVHGARIDPSEFAIEVLKAIIPATIVIGIIASLIELILKYSVFKIGVLTEKYGNFLAKLEREGINLRDFIGRELSRGYVGLRRKGLYLIILGVLGLCHQAITLPLVFDCILQSINITNHNVTVDYSFFFDPLIITIALINWTITIVSLILFYGILSSYGNLFNVASAKTVAIIYVLYQVINLLGAFTQTFIGSLKNLLAIVFAILLIIYTYKLYSETRDKTKVILNRFMAPDIESTDCSLDTQYVVS